ncbi:MAG: flagellar filament capping protein FliD [Oscillospiraceae bacterium]|nr:flagellar filament capping protein FliD [Oscillospiraceae bacterium]
MINNNMNKLRFGGFNSGLDTDAIVRAMSGATRMRLNNNKRKVLMLQAQQSAYQDVISKFQKFQDTYFNLLNTNNFLKGTAIFNQSGAKVYTKSGGVETLGAPAGVSVTTATGATPGSYKVELLTQATQAAIKGGDFAGSSAIDFERADLKDAVKGDSFAFSITVGGVSKNIVAEIEEVDGVDETAQEAINRALKDAFGTSNDKTKGLVSVDADGIISSSEGKAISLTNIIKMSDEQKLEFDALGFKNGLNSFYVQVGDALMPITFRTVDKDYFNIFFNSTNTFVGEAGKEAHLDDVASQKYTENFNKAYDAWLALPTTTPSVIANMKDEAFKFYFDKKLDEWFQDALEDAWQDAFDDDDTLIEADWKADFTKKNEKSFKAYYRDSAEGYEKASFALKTNKEAYEYIYNSNKVNTYEWIRESAEAEYNVRLADLEDASLNMAYEGWLDAFGTPALKESAQDDLFKEYFQYRLNLQQETEYNKERKTEFDKALKKAYDDYVEDEKAADRKPVALKDWTWKDAGDNEITLENWDWEDDGGFNSWQEWRQDKIDKAADLDKNWENFYKSERNAAYEAARKEAYEDYVAAAKVINPEAVPPSYSSWTWRDSSNVIITSANWDWEDAGGYADWSELKEATMEPGGTPIAPLVDGDDVDPNMPALYDRFLRSTIDGGRLDEELFRELGYREVDAFKYYTENGGMSALGIPSSIAKPTAADAVKFYNESRLKNELQKATFPDGTILDVEYVGGEAIITAYDEDDNAVNTAITFNKNYPANKNEDGTNLFGLEELELKTATVSTSATLASLGIEFPPSGTSTIKINGVSITIKATQTVNEMMNAVNASNAGVTMTFSTLTNSFSLTAKEYGTGGNIEFGADAVTTSVMERLGLDKPVEAGKNLELKVNDKVVETTGNSYTLNGTTFKFDNNAATNVEFRVEVGKDNTQALEAIKNFVNDYNQLIEDIYGMLKEKPNKSYYFLTDDDIEESGFSDRQVQQWETMSKKGLLYNNSTISDVMTRLRMALLSTTAIDKDGKKYGLFNIRGNAPTAGGVGAVAIQPSSDYKKNGMLEINEQALIEALERDPEAFMKLFTGDDGIMANMQKELDRAISTKIIDDKGTREGALIRMAGTSIIATTNNTIFERIKNLNQTIDILQGRYEREQDRYWKIFTNMEKQFADLNSQGGFISNMFPSNNNQ